ncbi:MAG: prepilin-type N-terminal cleavage/methylation domain-containing protein [Elusimicrobiaceae bacterium]|nr:prepilin-type N-terminal cleavage/methylation domain-containing protein [Elusimicrobiaceae bacterium]
MKAHKGFTLIELLVVVLIIGILSAVALPQYKAAVLKSRLATAMTQVEHGRQLYDVYYMANGTYDATLEDVGFEIAGCQKSSEETTDSVSCRNAYYHHLGDNHLAGVIRGKGYNPIAYTASLSKNTIRYCMANPEDKAANNVCKSFGATFSHQSTDWVSYKMP